MVKIDGFDWDHGNSQKVLKHGVSRAEIEGLFLNEPFVGPDFKNSKFESRYLAVGRSEEGRPIFVVFAIRIVGGSRLIRPISARYMHAKEINRYEKEIKKDLK